LPRERHLQRLMALESVDITHAEEWIRHRYHATCPPLTADCPRCGSRLRTWRASSYLGCGERW
jgi:hypothetical protein